MPVTRSRLRKVLFRVAAVLAGLAVSALAAEVALRVAGWPSPGLHDARGRGPLPLRVPDGEGGAYPTGPGRLVHYDYDVEWTVGAHGFRERDPVPKRAGERRALLLGDSFAAGVGVELGSRFGDVWFRETGRAGRGETLWTLASSWCGTAQSAAILRGVGRAYEVDEIVLAFYGGNDLEDNEGWRRKVAGTAAPPSGSFRIWLRERSRLATFVWVYGLRSFASFRPPAIHSKETLDELWPDTDRALGELLEAAAGRPLRVWYLPNVSEWDDALWEEVLARHSIADPVRTGARDRLEDWCRAHGVPFADATPFLAGSRAQDLVFPVDPHWNAEGHRRVGEGLARESP